MDYLELVLADGTRLLQESFYGHVRMTTTLLGVITPIPVGVGSSVINKRSSVPAWALLRTPPAVDRTKDQYQF